ncbi:DUF1433 domain-containing protein [Listeria booriae]|uniref:DUF1433 domain-containing protein n=1 Tax=Listeria booriae TaxID=1552123 RepID=UPI00164D80A6|nr:DUF1433 domain-containing protein [Listeria booriae]MBC6164643.1 DUF1433 domain-containing protein [Listeria booriae]
MKKKKLVISVVVIILIIAGGSIFMKYQNDKREETAFWDEQKPRIEKFITYNFNGITSITFDDDSATVNPTGVPHLKGYLNGDKSLSFDAAVGGSGKFETGISFSEGVQAYMKKEYKLNPRSVSEIEAEEKAK